MNSDTINKTLAEYEGKCWHKHQNIIDVSVTYWAYYDELEILGRLVCKCGKWFYAEQKLNLEGEPTNGWLPLSNTDYTSSLDDCMRVARKMKANAVINNIQDRITIITYEGLDKYSHEPVYKSTSQDMDDPDKPAHTLATMLAEIAE